MSRELAIPMESMKMAYSLFKEHAECPADGSLLNDGFVTKASFGSVLSKMQHGEAVLNSAQESQQLDAAFRVVRKDLSSLNFREFAIWYSSHGFDEGLHLDAKEQSLRKLARKLNIPACEIDAYKRHFDCFDADGSGLIDIEEFEEMLYKCGRVPRHIGLPASRVSQLWCAADVDGSGEIDFEEFVLFYRRYFVPLGMGERTGFERIYMQGIQLH